MTQVQDSARCDGRRPDELRPLGFSRGFTKYAEGSVLVSAGDTRVLCTATVTPGVPRFLTGKGEGRTQEIQRLIGRSLRAAVDRRKLGEFTIQIDCDVLQADGGTRCASISGAWVALRDAVNGMLEKGQITEDPILTQVSAVSAGIVDGRPVLDLNYVEDSGSDTDMNVVMTGEGRFVEIQGTAEGAVFSRAELDELLRLAEKGNLEIMTLQRAAFE